MPPQLLLAMLLAQDSSPDSLPTNPPYVQRIDEALTSYCADSDEELQDAKTMSRVDPQNSISSWSAYVKSILRCAGHHQGIVQARLYAAAIAQITGSILYLKPDADVASVWRKRASTLITKALEEAQSDPDLVSALKRWQDELPY